jgi:hypothetical protein
MKSGPPDTKDHAMTRRHLILRVVVPAITAAAVAAPGASAMPQRDADSAAGTHAKKMHHDARPPALVDALAHADTMRRIGARLTARSCA